MQKRISASLCLWVCQCGRAKQRFVPEEFSSKYIFETSIKPRRSMPVLITIEQQTGKSHDNLHTSIIITSKCLVFTIIRTELSVK
jgi:hypothetical protein